jgi:hypothetical protein
MIKSAKYIITILFLFYLTSFAFAQINFGNSNKDIQFNNLSATIDYGYFQWNTSNRSLFEFADDVENLNIFIVDKIQNSVLKATGDGIGERKLSFFIGGIFHLFSHYALEFTLHEFGHWNRSKAVGYTYNFTNRSANAQLFYFQTLLKPGIHTSSWDDTNENIIKFYLDKHNPYVNYYNGRIAAISIDWDMVSTAAGFSNDMRLSAMMANRMYNNRGYVTDILPYSFDKLFPFTYKLLWDIVENSDDVGGDHSDLSLLYHQKGWDINESDIANAALLSYMLSASTYAYFMGAYRFFLSGERRPAAFEYAGFRIPDIQAYFERGISYKFISGYRVNQSINIPFAVENVFKGDKRTEYSLGLNLKIKQTILINSNIIYGKKIEGGVRLGYAPFSHLFFYGGFLHNNVHNLNGMRNIQSLEKGDGFTEYFIGLKIKI